MVLFEKAMTERTSDLRLAEIYCDVSMNRPVNLDKLCDWINTHLGPVLKAGSGQLDEASVKEFIKNTPEHVDAFFEANYLASVKHKIKASVEASGTTYPTPQIAGTVLQYIAPAFVSLAHPTAGFVVAVAAGVSTWYLQSHVQQRAAVIPSELLQKRNSTFLKTAGKYEHTRGEQAVISQRVTTSFIAAANSVRSDENFKAMALDQKSAPLKDKLEGMKAASIEARTAIIDQIEAALGHTRQEVGAKRQTWLKIFRPAATMIPILMRHPTIANKLQAAGLPELTKPGAAIATAGIAVVFQVIQHFLARGDEWSKVEIKVMLNLLCAHDYLTDAGIEALWRGELVKPEHVLEDKFRAYASGPCHTLSMEIKEVVSDQRKASEKLDDHPSVVADLQRQMDTLAARRIGNLQRADFASKLFEREMKSNFAANYFQCNLLPNGLEKLFERAGWMDTHYLLYHQSAKRSNDPDDLRAQYIQRAGSAVLHGYGALSSTVSQNIARVPVIAAGDIERVSMALLATMLATSVAIGFINAYGSAETQTVKNVNKFKDSERKKAEAQAVRGTEAQTGETQSRMGRIKENLQRMNQAASSFYGFLNGGRNSELALRDLKAAIQSNLDLESSLQALIDNVARAKDLPG